MNERDIPLVQTVTGKYHVLIVKQSKCGTLVDRGANGGIIGNNTHVFRTHIDTVDVTGIDNHALPSLKLVDASTLVQSNHGLIVIIMQQYAYHGLGCTIHSSSQLEHYKNIVEDRSMKCGGKQCICTHVGYIIPNGQH